MKIIDLGSGADAGLLLQLDGATLTVLDDRCHDAWIVRAFLQRARRTGIREDMADLASAIVDAWMGVPGYEEPGCWVYSSREEYESAHA